ncbi:efflux RND transporter periplasmic adaptor subunit [Trichocoleus sp. FACHB-262]|uniref:efflux RND transporter periplasmic adaptor subunit n=1 Tax=Trichocoleus sp. FACHB-262 TaxID=2692869 RepID=UPI00168675DF|nr:efflux RND transporter periplasmic adaptor subunit [Trichocoleus sp. FACHB-262]MBD2120615.1 efflux RND transporter periplasmic adaptor subunit [Trichocoleus sp. FACHB-262]
MIAERSQKELRRGIRSLAVSGVLALAGIGSWLVYSQFWSQVAKPVVAPLVTVERDTIETTINESGTVELRSQQTLKSPTEGAVEQVLVQPGDTVKAGQTLVVLRYPERQTALANQQVKIQKQALTLERDRQKILELQEQLADEEREQQKLENLSKQGALAQQRVQEQVTQVRELRTTLRNTESGIRTGALELESLQLEKQRIQQQLRDTVVTAPIDGLILDVKVKDGDGVELRTDLLTLGDPSQELVTLQLSTLNAVRVKVNQPARITVIGPDKQVFTGRVQSLYPQAIAPNTQEQNSRRGSSQSNQATVPATVRLDRPTRSLIPGSQVNVELVIEERPNVVALNTEAIQRTGATPFVWIRDAEGKAEKRSVDLGLEGLVTVEVKSGLQPGEKVILPPPEPPLEPGMQVTPQTEAKPSVTPASP